MVPIPSRGRGPINHVLKLSIVTADHTLNRVFRDERMRCVAVL